MASYETTLAIAAPPAEVWAATCDIEKWPTWSVTMDAIERLDAGPLRPGSRALVRQPKLREATWVVISMDTDATFVWQTRGPGFRVVASHFIAPSSGGTSLRLRVDMTGPVAPLGWLLAGRTTRRYLDQEAAGLQAFCERP